LAAGLATYQWNNQIKSVLLLLGFPLLLTAMVFAFFVAGDLWWQAHPDLQNIYTGYSAVEEAGQGMEVPPSLEGYRPAEFNVDQAVERGAARALHYGPLVFLGAGLWFVVAFFMHGAIMRAATHAQPVTRAQMPRIYNMLENLCISRGIPMPKFEVIDSPALNAFATGINDRTYKIVLTRGIIERLPDDELEAVIAHELSHILNRDVRLLIIAVIFVGIISFFAQMVYRMLLHGGRPNYYARGGDNGRRGGAMLVSMLIALAILMIGYVFALLIRFALSRKREYLADAGAVELTKNPEAMMKALQRISGNEKVAGLPSEVQQMCIENSQPFWGMFGTHPPIADRIRAIAEITGTPVPELQVSLRRGPRSPWERGKPPAAGAPEQRGPWDK
jgi:heat shock protein HtpX